MERGEPRAGRATSSLARFLARNHAGLLALSASLPEREPAVHDAVAAARAARPDASLAIMLGGALATGHAVADRFGVDNASNSLVEAARFARSLADGAPRDDPA